MPTPLLVLYPPRNYYDSYNHTIWAAGCGAMIKHRTIDTLSPDEWTVRVQEITTGLNVHQLPPDTHLWCLGPEWLKLLINDSAIDKHRGYRLSVAGRPMIASYKPIDCWQLKKLAPGEKEAKPEAGAGSFDSVFDDGDDDSASDGKDVAATARKNYLFWTLADFAKLLRPPIKPLPATTHTCMSPHDMARILLDIPKNFKLFIDIETRYGDHILDCIGFGWIKPSDGSIFACSVPFYYGDTLADTPAAYARFWKALYLTFSRPDITIVGHNLAFDLFMLHHYYHLPLPARIFDTMLFMHRHHTGVDKSLSHAMSYYTDLSRNHKGDYVMNTSRDRYLQLAAYNCLDNIGTIEVWRGQQRAAAANPALARAAEDANVTQVLSFKMSFTGILVDTRVQAEKISRAELLLSNLARIINILVGREFNAASSKQCADYFFRELNYPVLELTETGLPKMDTKNLYQLQLEQPNPLLPLIIEYREQQKELSMLKFEPYVINETNL